MMVALIMHPLVLGGTALLIVSVALSVVGWDQPGRGDARQVAFNISFFGGLGALICGVGAWAVPDLVMHPLVIGGTALLVVALIDAGCDQPGRGDARQVAF